jgi:hypothetical protein
MMNKQLTNMIFKIITLQTFLINKPDNKSFNNSGKKIMKTFQIIKFFKMLFRNITIKIN